jgi:2,3-bisphosphoglycerate-dependent phosphoglycerate mutase
LLRHGQSQWNLENKFTGWTDVDLTDKGIKEAKNSGSLILSEGINIDLAFSSILKRAIRTCKICLKELKKNKIKYVKDWRLNERHYGALQGLNKAETAKKYGEDQVLIWRRSYDSPPPELDIYDERHPLNDKLYSKINSNLLPKSESLKDTLVRVNPFLEKNLLPKVGGGKNCLVVAHGNSLRAIIKIIKNISDEDILKLNIPTGTPYVFKFDDKLEVVDDYYLGI